MINGPDKNVVINGPDKNVSFFCALLDFASDFRILSDSLFYGHHQTLSGL